MAPVLPQPPYVALYPDYVEIREVGQPVFTLKTEFAEVYARTYAKLMRITFVDRRKSNG